MNIAEFMKYRILRFSVPLKKRMFLDERILCDNVIGKFDIDNLNSSRGISVKHTNKITIMPLILIRRIVKVCKDR